jgi:hypothetical protein
MKRAMAMATKRAMVTNGNTMDNGHGKEGGGHSTAAIMAINGDGDGAGDGAKDMAACTTTGERGMMVAMDNGLCVLCVCVERPQKIRKRAKSWMYPRAYKMCRPSNNDIIADAAYKQDTVSVYLAGVIVQIILASLGGLPVYLIAY